MGIFDLFQSNIMYFTKVIFYFVIKQYNFESRALINASVFYGTPCNCNFLLQGMHLLNMSINYFHK